MGTALYLAVRSPTWKPRAAHAQHLSSVAFVSPAGGWAVGDQGTILHTTDGGQSWQAQSSGTQQHLSSVAFAFLLSGWAVGYEGTILHTRDGGQSWQAQIAAHHNR